jgi:hypothetical protein
MIRTLRSTLAIVLVALFAATAVAGSNTVFSFLRNDVGARAAALAGSALSLTDDPTAFLYNPASAATLASPRGSLGFFKHLLDINAGHLTYGRHIEGFGHSSASVVFTHYGSFKETDASGNELGTFHASDLAFTLGYARGVAENLYAGVNVKFIHSSIAGSSSAALAGDAGLLYVIPDSRITLGASLRNLGAQLSTYLGTREDLPVDLSIGGSIIPRGLPLLLNLGFHRIQQAGELGERLRFFTIGGEFTLSTVVRLRIGYDNAERKDLKLGTSAGLAGFSAGLGITIREYVVDYAASSLGEVGTLHRISLQTSL